MLIFKNDGLIDLRVVTLMGASVKESAQAIGYFGTGLKYAISVILREGGKVTIYRGLDCHVITTRPISIRGKTFNSVYLDETELSYTTELGKNWEPWMAFREFYCNALDESGTEVYSASFVDPEEGKTTIVVEGIDHIWDERENIITSARVKHLAGSPEAQILDRDARYIFYRNVRVSDCSKVSPPPYFCWNIKRKIDLTEDRTVKYGFELGWAIAEAVIRSKDEELIRTVLELRENTLEYYADWSKVRGLSPRSTFMKTVSKMRDEGKYINPIVRENWCLVMGFSKFTPINDITSLEEAYISKALDFLHKIGYKITEKVIIVEGLGNGVYGTIDRGDIIISRECFSKGLKFLAGTILEEHVHIKYSLNDCTYGMQNWLLDQLINQGEKVVGEPL